MSRLRRPILHSCFFLVTTNLRRGLRPFSDTEYQLLAEIQGPGTRPRGNLCILFHARSRTRYLVPTGRNNNFRRNDAFQDRCLATNPADQGKGVLAEPILRPGSANSPRVRRRGSVSTNKLRRVRLHSHEPGASGARRRFVDLALVKRPLVRGRDGTNCDGSSATTDEPLGSALTKRRR